MPNPRAALSLQSVKRFSISRRHQHDLMRLCKTWLIALQAARLDVLAAPANSLDHLLDVLLSAFVLLLFCLPFRTPDLWRGRAQLMDGCK